MDNKRKLLLIGPYPEPYGGVSIHLKRLVELLDDDFEILKIDESRTRKPDIFNLRSLRFVEYMGLIKKSDIIHVHSGHYIFRLAHLLASKIFNKKIVVSVHSYEVLDKSSLEKHIDRFIFKNSLHVIYVTQEISKLFPFPNYSVKEAFLPPVLGDEPQLPRDLNQWITKKKNEGYHVCIGNASRLDLSNNEDLYGLDLFIEAAHRCKEKQMKIAFVFVISDTTGQLKIATYQKLIEKYDLSDIFFMYEAPLSFVKLILESDIVLRPTNTDGDALTVREGLFLDKKVIASDVTGRPKGTYLFKSRNMDALMKTLQKVYDELNSPADAVPSEIERPKTSDYRNFYKQILDA